MRKPSHTNEFSNNCFYFNCKKKKLDANLANVFPCLGFASIKEIEKKKKTFTTICINLLQQKIL